MNFYRATLIFCRALVFYFGVQAGIGLIAFVISFSLLRMGYFGLGGYEIVTPLFEGGIAIVLWALSRGVAAALVGQNVLEGEAIQSAPLASAEERALGLAWGGLLLLIESVLGVASYSVTVYTLFTFLSSRLGSRSPLLYLVMMAIPHLLRGAIGLFFAFRLNLKRMLPQ